MPALCGACSRAARLPLGAGLLEELLPARDHRAQRFAPRGVRLRASPRCPSRRPASPPGPPSRPRRRRSRARAARARSGAAAAAEPPAPASACAPGGGGGAARSSRRAASPPSRRRRSGSSRPRSRASARRPRRAARGRGRRAARCPGTRRAPPRAPRGSPGRGGSSARRASAGSRPTRPRAPARAGAARRRRAPTPALLVLVPAGEEEAAEQVLRLGPLQPGLVLDALEHGPAARRARPRAGRSTRARRRGRGGASRARARRRPRSVSSSVVLPVPFGPTSATCSPRSIANDDVVEQLLVTGRERRGLRPRRPSARCASACRNSKPRLLRAPREQLELAGVRRALLLQAADVRQLGLRLLRLRLLVAEPLDEAVEPRDVDVDALGRLRGVQRRARPSRAASRATCR